MKSNKRSTPFITATAEFNLIQKRSIWGLFIIITIIFWADPNLLGLFFIYFSFIFRFSVSIIAIIIYLEMKFSVQREFDDRFSCSPTPESPPPLPPVFCFAFLTVNSATWSHKTTVNHQPECNVLITTIEETKRRRRRGTTTTAATRIEIEEKENNANRRK